MTGPPSELQNKLRVQQQGFKEGPHFLHSPGHHLEEFVKYRPSPGLLNQSLWRMGIVTCYSYHMASLGNTVLDSRRNFPHRDEPGEEGESTLGAP